MTKPKYACALDVKRPIIPGFYPDPSIVRVGDTFYVANSTFEYGPGVPIHSSKDLVNWKFEGHALPTAQQADISGMRDSAGIFAPTLRYRNGTFFLITTLMDGRWQLIVRAPSVQGPWSEALRVDLFGIDPDLAWDDDGRCFMTYASLALGGISQVQVDLDTGSLKGEPVLLWQGLGGKFPEGPHLYQVGGWWYLVTAEGGTERGHAVAVARSKSIRGPFEADPQGILLSNRGTDFEIQSTGHADLAQRENGSWVMVFHGTRPVGSSPEWHILGRETCAVEIEWHDGWPRLGAPIEPAVEALQSEYLDSNSELPVEWISPGSWPAEVFTKSDRGLIIEGFAGRRQTSQIFEATASIESHGQAGLCVFIDSRHKLELLQDGNKIVATWTIGDNALQIGSICPEANNFQLAIRSERMLGGFHDPLGPDKLLCQVIYPDGSRIEVAALDGRYLSTEVAGGMTGRVVGVVARQKALIKEWSYKSL